MTKCLGMSWHVYRKRLLHAPAKKAHLQEKAVVDEKAHGYKEEQRVKTREGGTAM
jgi:hypothetical protein